MTAAPAFSATTRPVDTYEAAAAPLPAIEWVEVSAGPRGGIGLRAGTTVDPTDVYLAGHFPELTVYPGVFTLETIGQAVTAAVGYCAGRLPHLHLLRSARFLAPLLAGDTLTVEASVGPVGEDQSFDVTARCVRGDGVHAATVRAVYRWPSADGGNAR
ncbi:Beta-hydroxyacyl-(Acyl-carrier-protein) dehydratase, FabA/FabZ [Micromonospora lupini]|uniref:Beta-hydroxyacyl-(Acyl-carrier-protein) dehydratase, FabA/FabZ n=1 Tax=Micromonospora lupini str. Lupac 08 TaxID=1150864 RepID=I0L4B7_9ACTN|nr:Beta-hydroxyacyl-(Acyl-carrier-protein) dehydratase, FabA/FabZ [Micromonospora lupini]CCH18664.1 Beta-hydroxyacyl-(Acyl-carrier-protein) dehydratase, FabA/FabZ [Micromonospora lupini str. Lupac 08]